MATKRKSSKGSVQSESIRKSKKSSPARSRRDSGLKFRTPPDEYAAVAQSQRAWARDIADRLERGEAIEDGLNAGFAAAILRGWAAKLSDVEPGDGRSTRAKVCYSTVALEHETLLRSKSMNDLDAVEHLAGKYEVSSETIRTALSQKRRAAKEAIDFLETHSIARSYKVPQK